MASKVEWLTIQISDEKLIIFNKNTYLAVAQLFLSDKRFFVK